MKILHDCGRAATLLALGAACLASASVVQAAPVYTCHTKRLTIEISALPHGQYAYQVWNKPHPTSGKPDLVLGHGTADVQGTQMCTTTVYAFHRGDVEYDVATPVGCTEEIPPKQATGTLDVMIHGDDKLHAWCMPR